MAFLYKGSSATFIKTSLACIGLFGFSGLIQNRVNQSFNLQPDDTIPLSAQGLTVLGTGATVAVLSSPFDIIKTILQRPNSTENQSTLHLLKNNIQRFGISGLTAGLPIKLSLTIIG